MLPKEDRKALLLRLFDDDTPLVNLSQRHANNGTTTVEVKMESSIPQEGMGQRHNSSSDEEGGGGVPIDGIPIHDPARNPAEDVAAEPSIS